VKTWDWCSTLHHLELLSPEQTRALLRAGADVHMRAPPSWAARALAALGNERMNGIDGAHGPFLFAPGTDSSSPGGPSFWVPRAEPRSPVDIAEQVLADTLASDAARRSAVLVRDAGQPWSPDTHALFPQPAREAAVAALACGYVLAMRATAPSILPDSAPRGGQPQRETDEHRGEGDSYNTSRTPRAYRSGDSSLPRDAAPSAQGEIRSIHATSTSSTGGDPAGGIVRDVWVTCVMPLAITRAP